MKIIKAFFMHPIWHYSPLKIAALVKADWNGELVPKADYERVRKDFADLVEGRVGLAEIAQRNGATEVRVTTEIAGVMADGFLKLLEDRHAPNYVEMSFKRRGDVDDCVTVTVRRKDGKTPHQLRALAEADRDKIKAAALALIQSHGADVEDHVLVLRSDFNALAKAAGREDVL